MTTAKISITGQVLAMAATRCAKVAFSQRGAYSGCRWAMIEITIINSSIIRGAVICESTDGTQAVYTDNTPQIIYDPTLFTSPPMGYTSAINMKIVPGSWRQTVQP